ncbi:hypothetical protein CRYUN_Cryun22dG0001300 [Craigia yunnanensis]
MEKITKALGSKKGIFTNQPSSVGFSLGDGGGIRFWEDVWTEEGALKSAFPRIFTLSVNKLSKVNEFGFWSNNVWQWKILLRRRLFGWEFQQWLDLLSTLKGIEVCDSLKDSFVWKGSLSGKYSVNLYCKSVSRSSNMDREIWKSVWMGLAPPKVEAFCWQLMRGRIATKDQLACRGLLDWSRAVCTFCKSVCESSRHLFFACSFT